MPASWELHAARVLDFEFKDSSHVTGRRYGRTVFFPGAVPETPSSKPYQTLNPRLPSSHFPVGLCVTPEGRPLQAGGESDGFGTGEFALEEMRVEALGTNAGQTNVDPKPQCAVLFACRKPP